MTDSLSQALARASSRLAPPRTPAISMAIHLVVLVLWLALFGLAFGYGGVLAWSVGLAYLAYDAALQIFIGGHDPAAIGAVRQAFSSDAELTGVTGVITPVCAPTASGRVLQWFQTYEYVRNFLGRYAWMQLDCLQLISGAFAGFRRTAVADVGGFDDACLVEDYALVARMQRFAGERGLTWRFRVLGSAQAHTEAPGTVAGFCGSVGAGSAGSCRRNGGTAPWWGIGASASSAP